jgi:transposase
MLSISPATRIYVALGPLDMRKSFNSLCAYVDAVLGEEPLSGHLFVFTNRLRNRLKLILRSPPGRAARESGSGRLRQGEARLAAPLLPAVRRARHGDRKQGRDERQRIRANAA